jgi:hypothetical protein
MSRHDSPAAWPVGSRLGGREQTATGVTRPDVAWRGSRGAATRDPPARSSTSRSSVWPSELANSFVSGSFDNFDLTCAERGQRRCVPTSPDLRSEDACVLDQGPAGHGFAAAPWLPILSRIGLTNNHGPPPSITLSLLDQHQYGQERSLNSQLTNVIQLDTTFKYSRR